MKSIGNLYISLHTSDPTDADSGVEADYSGYERVAVPRPIIGWSVSENVVTNVGDLIFPVSLGTTNLITHWAVRTALTGGDLIGSGALTGAVEILAGDTPKFLAGQITIQED